MSTFHQLLILILFIFIDVTRQEIAPIFTPDDSQLIKNHKPLDQLDKSSAVDLQTSEIVLPATISLPANQTNSSRTTVNNTQNKLRKRKYQSNKQYRPNERKSQLDSLAYNLDSLKKTQLNELNNALLLQLANQKLVNNQQDTLDKYNPLLASIANQATNNEQMPFLVPIYTTESPSVNLLNDPNQLAVQLYLRKLAQLAQLQKQARSGEHVASERQQEKPKLQKRVSNQPLTSSSSSNLPQFANLNQLLQASNQQPIYTLVQPQAQSSQPFYLALQPSFPVMPSATTSNRDTQTNPQVTSLIETGDKIFAKIKQWSTDFLNPKSSLNRQIGEVLGVVSDVALVTLISVPVLSLLSLGVSTLMQPLSQLNRKADRTKSASKQKTKTTDEKKDNKDEKTAKSDSSNHVKNTKALDKKSRLVSLMERAGDEFNHFKNLVEIAKNIELAFKKYNVVERDCKYRVLCEISTSQMNDTVAEQQQYLSNNLLREGRILTRQARSASNKMSNTDQLNKCTTNCTSSASSTTVTSAKLPANERNQRAGGFKNLIRNLIDDNRESFINFVTTVDQLMNRAQRSNFFNYLLTEDQLNQAFRSDSKLFKTIAERSKQLQDKLKDFLENLTVFQQVVSKESQNLDNSNKKLKMFNYYNLARSKRTANSKSNTLNQQHNETYMTEDDNDDLDGDIDVSGLKFVLSDLIHQLKFEQNQDNLILSLSRIWLNPYLTAYEYGQNHSQSQ